MFQVAIRMGKFYAAAKIHTMPAADSDRATGSLRQPHPNLLKYYAIESLLLGPFFPLLLLPRLFRFRTLRYEIGEHGITARWGVLFRREISLDYERIQDIHLASNLIERRLGLGRVQVQTAAGSAKAELTVEGLQDFEQVRDFLYARMRGAQPLAAGPETAGTSMPTVSTPTVEAIVAALHETAGELRELRRELAARRETSRS